MNYYLTKIDILGEQMQFSSNLHGRPIFPSWMWYCAKPFFNLIFLKYRKSSFLASMIIKAWENCCHIHSQDHTGAKSHFLSRNSLDFDISKIWILWELRFQKCEFCEKWDYRKVNFVKNEISERWLLWKVRFYKREFCENEISERWIL